MSKYKRNKAVALKYNAGEDAAPVVIASGYGNVAEKIIDIAEKKGIPVYKDDSTASMLCMLEVGCDIPVELYEVVAAIYGKLMEVSESIKGKEVQYYSREERLTAKEYRRPGKEPEKESRPESGQESRQESRRESRSESRQGSRSESGNESVRQSVRARLISTKLRSGTPDETNKTEETGR